MTPFIAKLVDGRDLTEGEAAAAMAMAMSGEASPVQMAGFLVALRAKGESVDEIAGLARTARALATPIQIDSAGLLDTCGTGGDGTGSINISTLAALVAAGAGARVAKHGNRAASSQCGSADVLEQLGVRIDLEPPGVVRCIEEAGIGFLFAPRFHPSFRHFGPVRRELGVRTVFNLLGPLCNPAGAPNQALGVAERGQVAKLAEVLVRLGVERALVFHGSDGMDELTTWGTSLVVEVIAGDRVEYQLDPAELGFRPDSVKDLCGGGAERNAGIARQILEGADGPPREAVLLNAAAALRAAGLARDWREGIGLAVESLDSGRAGAVLERWVRVSREQEVAPA